MVRDGRAAVLQYRWDGRLVASDLLLIGHRYVGAYLYGAIPDLRSCLDVTLMMLRQDLALARERHRQGVSLLRGDEPYKLKWRRRRSATSGSSSAGPRPPPRSPGSPAPARTCQAAARAGRPGRGDG